MVALAFVWPCLVVGVRCIALPLSHLLAKGRFKSRRTHTTHAHPCCNSPWNGMSACVRIDNSRPLFLSRAIPTQSLPSCPRPSQPRRSICSLRVDISPPLPYFFLVKESKHGGHTATRIPTRHLLPFPLVFSPRSEGRERHKSPPISSLSCYKKTKHLGCITKTHIPTRSLVPFFFFFFEENGRRDLYRNAHILA